MAKIKAECLTCGPVRLRPADLTVRVCLDDDHRAYRFRCPRCAMTVVHDASVTIAALLVSVGVAEEEWRLPAELAERRDGPALTSDEVLDFHLLLARDDWHERLLDDGATDRM